MARLNVAYKERFGDKTIIQIFLFSGENQLRPTDEGHEVGCKE